MGPRQQTEKPLYSFEMPRTKHLPYYRASLDTFILILTVWAWSPLGHIFPAWPQCWCPVVPSDVAMSGVSVLSRCSWGLEMAGCVFLGSCLFSKFCSSAFSSILWAHHYPSNKVFTTNQSWLLCLQPKTQTAMLRNQEISHKSLNLQFPLKEKNYCVRPVFPHSKPIDGALVLCGCGNKVPGIGWLKTAEIDSLTLLEAKGPSLPGLCSFWRMDGEFIPCLFQLLVTPSIFRLVAMSLQYLPLSSRGLFLCVSMASPSACLRRTLCWHLGPTLIIQDSSSWDP